MKTTRANGSLLKTHTLLRCGVVRFTIAAVTLFVFGLTLVGGCSASEEPGDDKAILRSEKPQPTTEQPRSQAPAESSVKQGNLYALVVGVASYKDPKIRKLNLSDDDAKAFARFLDSQKDIFRETHVTVLTNEQATKREIEKKVQYDLMKKAGKDDTVILFFSGHGSDDNKKPGKYFFLGHDADPEYLESTSVQLSDLKFLRDLDAKRVLVVIDACHAGGATKYMRSASKSLDKSLESFMREFGDSSGRAILSSSQSHEYSQEKPGLEQSVFTYYLLKALSGEADTNTDGVVTLHEAYEFVYKNTKQETEGGQTPQLEGARVGSFPLAVVRKPLELEVWFVAQDPRCTNRACTDPQETDTYCDDPLCGDTTLKDGDTMYTGQNYQMAFRTSMESYVYVYHIGSSGQLYKIFPGDDYLAPGNTFRNPLPGGTIHWIPGEKHWLRQDDQVGKEQIYVIASRTPNTVLEDLYSHLERLRREDGSSKASQEAVEQTRKAIITLMLPTKAKIIKAEHRSRNVVPGNKIRSFEQCSRVFESMSLDVVKSVWFTHENRR